MFSVIGSYAKQKTRYSCFPSKITKKLHFPASSWVFLWCIFRCALYAAHFKFKLNACQYFDHRVCGAFLTLGTLKIEIICFVSRFLNHAQMRVSTRKYEIEVFLYEKRHKKLITCHVSAFYRTYILKIHLK